MPNIKIITHGNQAALLGAVKLIAGTVGQKCTFYFDDEWKNLRKTISYKVGPTILHSHTIDSNIDTIPSQVLATAGLPLEIGITGRSSDNSIIMPTSWCLIGDILPGAVINSNNQEEDNDRHIIYDGGVIL